MLLPEATFLVRQNVTLAVEDLTTGLFQGLIYQKSRLSIYAHPTSFPPSSFLTGYPVEVRAVGGYGDQLIEEFGFQLPVCDQSEGGYT